MKTIPVFIIAQLLFLVAGAQNVGIGTTSPQASLHVAEGSVVFTSTGDIPAMAGNIPVSGVGRRLLWYADKAAFRAGYISGTNWDKNFIGNYSFAAGYDTKASGNFSTALGFNTASIGLISTAMGGNTIASGNYSTAMGANATASGIISTALGYSTTASGGNSTAMGSSTTASGAVSTAMGYYTTASGDNSTAIGNFVTTNSKPGSFIIGDAGVTATYSQLFGNDADNQMMMRFEGGYKLYSKGWGYVIGVELLPGNSSWSAISDRNKKENFMPVDAEIILQKIKNFSLTTWNYKGLDAKTQRHYGPMAQDFYAAFGKDALGKIGCDTLINEHDFSSINFIAIQALEKRIEVIEALQQKNNRLEIDNTALLNKFNSLAAKLEKLQQQVSALALLQTHTDSSVGINR